MDVPLANWVLEHIKKYLATFDNLRKVCSWNCNDNQNIFYSSWNILGFVHTPEKHETKNESGPLRYDDDSHLLSFCWGNLFCRVSIIWDTLRKYEYKNMWIKWCKT